MSAQPLVYHLNGDERFVFLHLPKTAGTTFTKILESNFDAQAVYEANWSDIIKLSPEDLARYRLITGHISYDICHWLPSQPLFLTMFRDPVERVISQYEQIRRLPEHYPDDPLTLYGTSLRDYVTNPQINIEISNFQTRVLGFDRTVQQLHTIYEYSGRDLRSTPLTEEHLKRARERLETFAFIGLLERFNDSVNLMTYTFGWPPVREVRVLNTAGARPRREDLPPGTLEAILEHNQLDLALYEYAQELFEDRYRAMLFDLLDGRYRENLSQYASEPPVTALYFDLQRALPGDGWHEYTVDQLGHRWTGPGNVSTLDLRLDRRVPLLLKFRVLTWIAPDVMESLTVAADDRLLMMTTQQDPSGGRLVYAVIPPDPEKHHGFTRLSLRVKRTISPRALGTGADERALGIAVNWIEIAPLT